MEGLEEPTLPSDNAARTEVTGTTAGSIANIPGADATGEAGSARVRDQSPPKGRANARHEEFARLQLENLRMQIRLEIQVEERERTERAQQERLPHGGGGMGLQQPGECIQPGTFMIDLRKPAPKHDNKVGSFFTWTKQMTSWAVSNTCEGALKETVNPIVFQGPNAKGRGSWIFSLGERR